MKQLLILPILVFVLAIGFSTDVLAQQSANLEVKVEYTNGDRVDHNEMQIKIFEGNKRASFLDLKPTSNPLPIGNLTKNTSYTVELYVNGMFAESKPIQLVSDFTTTKISIPLSGGFRFNVYYKDGQTPIDGAHIALSSHDGFVWRNGITTKDGTTMRFWMQPTIKPDNFYNVDVSLGENLHYKHSPVNLEPGLSKEIKIITNWPSIIQNLITVEVYKSPTQKISKSDGQFTVQLVDDDNKIVSQSPVDIRGQSYFSNLKVGEYTMRLVENSKNTLNQQPIATQRIVMSGMESTIKFISTDKKTQNAVTGTSQNCNCVAFRFDDVQDSWLSNPQMRVMDIFHERRIPLTIGVVGEKIGQDITLVNFIKDRKNSFEIANHGWNDKRLTDMTKTEQILTITNTHNKIKDVFGVTPTSFIPPGNLFDKNTIDILKQNGYTHLSAASETDPPPYSFSVSNFYRFPQTAETGRFGPGDTHFVGVSHDETLASVKNSISKNGYAVIMMHPQEFSIQKDGALENQVNESQISELESLLQQIGNEGIDIVPVGKINLDSQDREKFVYKYKPTCNCVAFRLDTVQDWWLADVNSEIIKKFNQKNSALTIGIIGNFIGDDPNIVSFLKDTLNQNNKIIIANNGWNYEDFTKLTKNEQKELLIKSNERIKNVLGIEPKVFLPPHNKFNADTVSALRELGFTHISSSVAWSTPPYRLLNSDLYEFPATANTGTFNANLTKFDGLPHQTSFLQIKNSIESNGFAVVLLGPQEFSQFENGQYVDTINQLQLDELEKLIAQIDNSEFSIVPLSKVNLDSTLVIPTWIRNNADWWSKDKITDDDFTKGIEYLIKQNIIKIPNLQKSTSSLEKNIPDWIKNNAGWWADGKITDSDFVSGIEYLVSKGIIRI